MGSLGSVIERLPTTWKALLALVAAGMGGWVGHSVMSSQVGLPARVGAVEVMVRDSAMPRIRSLESIANDNRTLIDQRTAQLDSISRYARQTCLALMELAGKSYRECE